MPTYASFRFSTYLALALACVTVGYAEAPLFPEVIAFAALAVIALGVLYFLESRVTLLSISAANKLGVGVALVYAMWAAYRVKREIDTAEFINMGWPTLIVALCGPLVMFVIVAKVARSDKHAGDYWTLHGIALAGVGLSAAFADEAMAFVLVGLYLVATVWSLTLLHLSRASGDVPPIPGGRQPATKTIPVSADPTGHRTDFRPALLWALIALAAAVPLYLLSPRSDAARAELGKPRIEIGFAADQMVDLNRTGPLQENREVAFEFSARYPDGRPKTDLPTDQRWRGKIYRRYYTGEWRTTEELFPHIKAAQSDPRLGTEGQLARRTEFWSAPNLGPGQFTLSFEVPAPLRSYFLADPVLWVPNEPPPLATITPTGPQGWMPLPDGTFFGDPNLRTRGHPRHYLQVYQTRTDPNVSPPFQFISKDYHLQLANLRNNPVTRVKEYADALLTELIATGQLPADCRDHPSLPPKPAYHDAIARKFAAHLATTPTLTYTTDLRRENKSLDPVEDFLFHTKAGHCERFATALTLMLRSQGIPAVFVLGFKGCEHTGDGNYVVRQEHAHAWVEALVPKPGEPEDPDDPRTRVYHWVSLDPTPSGGQDAGAGEASWWQQANNWVSSRFDEYVKNYTPEQRRKALAAFARRVARTETLVILALVGFLAFGTRFALRHIRRRDAVARAAPDANRWFGELVSLLAAHGIAPAPSDTPLEFATAASGALRERGCEDVADVPLAWAEAYYLDRFGGTPPTDARLAELDAGLERLREALSK